MPIFVQQTGSWPDGYDRTLTTVYLVVIFGLPLLGYFFMFLDFRRYLRSLRRGLVLVARASTVTPYWALRSRRPPCLKALGLELHCSEAEVLESYRALAKDLHPDRGGELDQFLQLQRYFEQALELVARDSQATEPAEVVRSS